MSSTKQTYPVMYERVTSQLFSMVWPASLMRSVKPILTVRDRYEGRSIDRRGQMTGVLVIEADKTLERKEDSGCLL